MRPPSDGTEVPVPYVAVVAAARPNFMKGRSGAACPPRQADTSLVDTGSTTTTGCRKCSSTSLASCRRTSSSGSARVTHAQQTAAVMERQRRFELEKHLLSAPTDAVVVVGDVNFTVASALTASKLQIPWTTWRPGCARTTGRCPRRPTPSSPTGCRAGCPPRARTQMPTSWPRDRPGPHPPGAQRDDRHPARKPRPDDRAGRDPARPAGRAGSPSLPCTARPTWTTPTAWPGCSMPSATPPPTCRSSSPSTEDECPARAWYGTPGQRPRPRAALLLDFIRLVAAAELVLTDSGGIQEETSVLGVPCLTIRDNRPFALRWGP